MRVLVFSCPHAPVMHPGAVDFLRGIYRDWGCNRVVCLGDLVDWHSVSFHEVNPDLPSPQKELEEAREQVAKLVKAFPKADCLMGNHDIRIARKATFHGLPSEAIRSCSELYKTGGWVWHPHRSDLVIDGVIYRHGDKGSGGKFAAMSNALSCFRSLVQGHHHTQGGVHWFANSDTRIFGMQTGCLVDHKSEAMRYGMAYAAKPILGCGVIIEGTHAYWEPMLL